MHTRRNILATAGSLSAVSLAGCTAFSDEDSFEETPRAGQSDRETDYDISRDGSTYTVNLTYLGDADAIDGRQRRDGDLRGRGCDRRGRRIELGRRVR